MHINRLFPIGIAFIGGSVITILCIYLIDQLAFHPIIPTTGEKVEISRPLSRYSIEELNRRTPQAGPITLGTPVSTTDSFTSYIFSFTSEGKKVTGLANIPKGDGPFPVIVQFRGYVERDIFTSGVGTKPSGTAYAANGFITLAPDFLGYGGSDMPSQDVYEERFQTYTVALDMLAAVETLSQADPKRIGIWGHSNGGHIALTMLAATAKPYPTTLWAPVSKPFPYSVLYFTDELSDGGKYLRGELARFEGLYAVDDFTFRTYVDSITAPMLIHQGTEDDAVPLSWSDDISNLLKEKGKNSTYYRYGGADHNMRGSWDTVVERDIEFFTKLLKQQ